MLTVLYRIRKKKSLPLENSKTRQEGSFQYELNTIRSHTMQVTSVGNDDEAVKWKNNCLNSNVSHYIMPEASSKITQVLDAVVSEIAQVLDTIPWSQSAHDMETGGNGDEAAGYVSFLSVTRIYSGSNGQDCHPLGQRTMM